MTRHLKLDGAITCALTVLLFVVFSPLLMSKFIYSDDIQLWTYLHGQGAYPQKWLILSAGRLVYYYFFELLARAVETVSDVSILRVWGLVGISLCASGFYVWIVRTGASRVVAFFASAVVFVQPAIGLYISWVVGLPMVLALMLSTLAAFSAQIGIEAYVRRGEGVRPVIVGGLVTVSLLVVALFAYQVTPLFFAVMILSLVLFDPRHWASMRREVYLYLALLFVSMCVYFLLHKFCVMPLLLKRHPEIADFVTRFPKWNVSLISPSDILPRLNIIATDVAPKALFQVLSDSDLKLGLPIGMPVDDWTSFLVNLNMFRLRVSKYVFASVLVTVCLATLRAVREKNTSIRNRFYNSAEIAFVTLITIVFVSIPVLLPQTNKGILARVVFPISSVIYLMLVWMVIEWTRLLPQKVRRYAFIAVLSGWLIFSAVHTEQGLSKAVSYHAGVYRAFERELVPYLRGGGRNVGVVLPRWIWAAPQVGYLSGLHYDELGGITQSWQAALIASAAAMDHDQAMLFAVTTWTEGMPYPTPKATGQLVDISKSLGLQWPAMPPQEYDIVGEIAGRTILRVISDRAWGFFALPSDEWKQAVGVLNRGFSTVEVGESLRGLLNMLVSAPEEEAFLQSCTKDVTLSPNELLIRQGLSPAYYYPFSYSYTNGLGTSPVDTIDRRNIVRVAWKYWVVDQDVGHIDLSNIEPVKVEELKQNNQLVIVPTLSKARAAAVR